MQLRKPELCGKEAFELVTREPVSARQAACGAAAARATERARPVVRGRRQAGRPRPPVATVLEDKVGGPSAGGPAGGRGRACTRRGRGSGGNACAASAASAPGAARPRVSGQARARATAPSTSAAFSCSWPGGSTLFSLRRPRIPGVRGLVHLAGRLRAVEPAPRPAPPPHSHAAGRAAPRCSACAVPGAPGVGARRQAAGRAPARCLALNSPRLALCACGDAQAA